MKSGGKPKLNIRDLAAAEHAQLGQLMVRVYGSLEGFPTADEQPAYYSMLANIGQFTEQAQTRILVAVAEGGELLGGVVYFGDMADYGSGGAATAEKHAAGIRLLAVDQAARGKGVGKALTLACIALAWEQDRRQVILHTTKAMKVAWTMYENMGFTRSPSLDFMQEELPVFGFRLLLSDQYP